MTKLSNSDVLNNLDEKLKHLEPSKREDLKKIIGEYKHLFSDVPSRTEMIHHDVEIQNTASPIKQHPYRLNPLKQKYLQQEIDYLLTNDFIEPSNSNWSSPCILVPKPDGPYRMCTDYRKVNNVTKTHFPYPGWRIVSIVSSTIPAPAPLQSPLNLKKNTVFQKPIPNLTLTTLT